MSSLKIPIQKSFAFKKFSVSRPKDYNLEIQVHCDSAFKQEVNKNTYSSWMFHNMRALHRILVLTAGKI